MHRLAAKSTTPRASGVQKSAARRPSKQDGREGNDAGPAERGALDRALNQRLECQGSRDGGEPQVRAPSQRAQHPHDGQRGGEERRGRDGECAAAASEPTATWPPARAMVTVKPESRYHTTRRARWRRSKGMRSAGGTHQSMKCAMEPAVPMRRGR